MYRPILVCMMAFLSCSCGLFQGAPAADGRYGKASVMLVLPKGVSLKPGDAPTAAAHPLSAAKITSITISVTAADMAAITQAVSMTTLAAVIDVPVGAARTFTATVKTDIGGVFSGSSTVDVSGGLLDVAVNMVVYSALITGNLSAAVSKPGGIVVSKSAWAGEKAAISTWAGAEIQVIDSTGAAVGAGVAAADGTYSVDVPDGFNYFVRARIGNVVLKAFVPSTTGAAAVNVNATTTAAVIALAQFLGVANLGEPGVSGATAIAQVDIGTTFAQILASPGLAFAAAALANEIAVNYDPNGVVVAVGAGAPPTAPTALSTTPGNNKVDLSWMDVPGAASYNIYWANAPGVTPAAVNKIAGITSAAYQHTGLVNGSTYYYVVTAVNMYGESAPSIELSATPAANTLYVSPNAATLNFIGDAVTLTASLYYPDGTAAAGAVFTWTSSDSAIATVSSSGVVTATGGGTCAITVTSSLGSSASVTINVVIINLIIN